MKRIAKSILIVLFITGVLILSGCQKVTSAVQPLAMERL